MKLPSITPRRSPAAIAPERRRPAVQRAAAVGTAGPDVLAEPAERTKAVLLPRDLLDGGEAIILAIKPSLWFMLFDSAKWIVGAMVLIISAGWFSQLIPSVSEAALMSVVLGVLGARIGIAVLRWVSRSYVLTNRRVMRIRGVFKADVLECPLVNIRDTVLNADFAESLANLGSLGFVVCDSVGPVGVWRNIPHPDDVHTQVRLAIDRARHCQPRI